MKPESTKSLSPVEGVELKPVSGAEWTQTDILPLLEHAMQLTVEVPCDCIREQDDPCLGDCVGSKIWDAIHRARKLTRAVNSSPMGIETSTWNALVSAEGALADAVDVPNREIDWYTHCTLALSAVRKQIERLRGVNSSAQQNQDQESGEPKPKAPSLPTTAISQDNSLGVDAASSEPRHVFVRYGQSAFCGAKLRMYSRCGRLETHSVHLSDDVVGDARVPFEQPSTSGVLENPEPGMSVRDQPESESSSAQQVGVEKLARKAVDAVTSLDLPCNCESYVCEHWKAKAISIIASVFASSAGQVEDAKKELREMFPKTYVVIHGLKIKLSPHDTTKPQRDFQGYSLMEAMQKVREWKEQQ